MLVKETLGGSPMMRVYLSAEGEGQRESGTRRC